MYERKLYSHSTKACSIQQSDCSDNVSIKHAHLLFKIQLTILKVEIAHGCLALSPNKMVEIVLE
jgi:hypothetical protein